MIWELKRKAEAFVYRCHTEDMCNVMEDKTFLLCFSFGRAAGKRVPRDNGSPQPNHSNGPPEPPRTSGPNDRPTDTDLVQPTDRPTDQHMSDHTSPAYDKSEGWGMVGTEFCFGRTGKAFPTVIPRLRLC